MKLAEAYGGLGVEEIKAALDGATLRSIPARRR